MRKQRRWAHGSENDVDVNEIMKDWGCSRAKGYQIIAELNAQLLKMNHHSIIIQGKCNRKWYFENCYGVLDDEGEDGGLDEDS